MEEHQLLLGVTPLKDISCHTKLSCTEDEKYSEKYSAQSSYVFSLTLCTYR